MQILILNGPNLNLLGLRQPEIYGFDDFDAFLEKIKHENQNVNIDYFQSNIEGELVNKLHEYGFNNTSIIFNPGGYSHYSVALLDAMKSIQSPVIEVHISNIHDREEFRQLSMTAKGAIGCISGLGLNGYQLAIDYFLKYFN